MDGNRYPMLQSGWHDLLFFACRFGNRRLSGDGEFSFGGEGLEGFVSGPVLSGGLEVLLHLDLEQVAVGVNEHLDQVDHDKCLTGYKQEGTLLGRMIFLMVANPSLKHSW